MSKILFTNAGLVRDAAPERRKGYHVLVEDNAIRAVSPKPIAHADATVIDAAGRTPMPGLIASSASGADVGADGSALPG